MEGGGGMKGGGGGGEIVWVGRTLRELIDALPPERAGAVFTHSSWAAERTASYERLEFLGDSVLELAVARALYDRFPEFSEGRMAKVRSHVVSRASCAVVSRELELGERLRGAGPTTKSSSRATGTCWRHCWKLRSPRSTSSTASRRSSLRSSRLSSRESNTR